jgi:outer membrane receptor protein involved in Fe transport
MHKRSYRPSVGFVFLVSGISAAQISQADEASATQSSASTLQEVVVTAQKREERLHDVPMGVTAITQEQLQRQQLVSLQDLQSQVPGLSLTQVQPGQTRITLRGLDVGGVGSTVTTYIDDTPFGSSNALANGFGLSGDFDTWDLQRVEVLRGPQGTLYGAGSEGGLLKYVTNAPDPTKLAGALQVGGEDIAHGQNAGSVKGMINLPITSSAAFRVSGFYVGEPGYIDDPQLGEKDINHGYRAGLHASLLWEATDNFSVKLNAFGQTLHTDGTPYIDVVGGAGNPIAPPANQLEPLHGDYQQYRWINEPSTNKYRIYSATLNWNLGGAALTSITSYGTTEQDLFIDASQLFGGELPVPLPFPGANPAPAGTTGGSVAESSDLTVKKFTQEFRLASSTAQALEWQVGAFYTHESSSLDENVGAYYIPSQALGLSGLEIVALDALYKEWAAFGQVTYHFNPAFDLAVGGRWSENKQSANESIGGALIPPQPPSTGESTDTDFTYSVAPRWHISKDTMLYARVATGYRPGGPNALPPTGVPITVPKSYEADKTVNYELGSRTTLLDNRLSVDVAAFLVDWKKIQLLEYVDNFGVNTNGGTARSKGVEWTFGLTPVTGLTFTLTGAYVDAYLTSNAPATGAESGDRLPYAPKWSTSLDGAYTWRAFSGFDGFAGATWSYIGSRVNDFASTPTAAGFVPNPQAELPSYDTVNLRAGLDSGRWTFELYGKNVGDKRGITYYTSTNTGTPDAGGVVSYVQPRTIGALVTARF